MKYKKIVFYTFLFLIVCLASVLRFYELDKIPPSLSWDEVAVGYNAYTIAHWARDEWGLRFPLIFKSFGDYKHPVHIYLTSLAVLFGGLNDFSVRFPPALFGVFNVVLIYFVSKELFRNKYIALVSSAILAISPYNIQFSRFNHELNFAIFFFMLGVLLFYRAINKKPVYLAFSALSFMICFITYHSAKPIVLASLLLLLIMYAKKILSLKRPLLFSIAIVFVFVLAVIKNPNLLGFARLNQTSISKEEFKKTALYTKTDNLTLGKAEFYWQQYLEHFSYNYLFISGDANPRHSIQYLGEFYKVEMLPLVIGFAASIYLGLVKRKKEALFLLFWALVAPIPSTVVASGESPHAARAMFMNASWHMMIALGIITIVSIFRNNTLRIAALLLYFILYIPQFVGAVRYYLNVYPTRYAIEWQYGMKEAVEFLNNNQQYENIYVDNIRQQPYIFFLYYLKTPLPDLLDTVIYEKSETKSYNTVFLYDKFQFGGWDWVNSHPAYRVLYILEPYKYSGLANINSFEVVKLIKYPDNTDAFYLVSGNW